jgi:hypothetical protein
MRLNSNDAKFIMQEFPNIKLSYVKSIHKKVSSANLFLAIPKGIKFFAWFRNFKQNSVCVFLEIDQMRRGIKNLSIKTCCFDSSLCSGKGTILHGTIVNMSGQPFYFVDELFYYKGEKCDKNQISMFNTIGDIFKHDIKQVAINRKNVIFGLPLITKRRNEMDKKILDTPYNIYCVQHRYFKNNSNYLNEKIFQAQTYKRNFIVRASINCDIYELFCKNDKNTLVKHSFALIQNYKTSVFMNGLFRNIKENINLDFLEESDDEEEFENISDNKFIKDGKEYIMECIYNTKFKSWKPLVQLEKGEICDKRDLSSFEKKNRY